MSMWARLLLAAVVNWVTAASLGLLHVVTMSGRLRLDALSLPGVVPVALLGSSFAAACTFPFVVWALRGGWRNLLVYGPVVWLGLAAYVLIALPRVGGPYGYYGMLLLAVLAVVLVGLAPSGPAR